MAMTSMPLANHETLPNWHKSAGSLRPATVLPRAFCTSVGIGSIILVGMYTSSLKASTEDAKTNIQIRVALLAIDRASSLRGIKWRL